MLVNIRTVQDEDTICDYCNRDIKVVIQAGNLPGYGNVWYKTTRIYNFLSMSRVTRSMRGIWKYRVECNYLYYYQKGILEICHIQT